MHETLLMAVGLVIGVSLLVIVSQKFNLPYPIVLVVAGIVFGFIPQIPTIHIQPDLVFLIVLPPVLFDAAQNISSKSLYKFRRIIGVMAFGYVFLTATAVAFVSVLLIPGFTLSQGFLLGAIVSPPDAVAATAVLRNMKLPKGMKTILEGESLLNDAASLTLFRFALIAVLTGSFSWYEITTGFVFVTVSGILIGLAIGYVFYAIYRWLPTTSNLDVALSIALPYLLYITAEELHASGVLAVVTGGIFISYHNHFIFSHSSRLKSGAIWSSLVFILNAVIFILIGFQFPDIIHGLPSDKLFDGIRIAALISLLIIGVRILAGLGSSLFTTFISRFITVAQSRPGYRNPLIISWIGMRGAISLASALAIPLTLKSGEAFPHRNLTLLITFVVIIVTLVLQGLSIPWVVKKIRPENISEDRPDVEQMAAIEIHLINAIVSEVQSVYSEELRTNEMLKNRMLQWRYKAGLLSKPVGGDDPRKKIKQVIKGYKDVMEELLHLQRRELDKFRRQEGFDDDVVNLIEKRLDLESEGLREEKDSVA